MPRTVERFETGSGTWEKKIDSAGREYYTGPSNFSRANGRVSKWQFFGAQSRRPAKEQSFSINNPSEAGRLKFREMGGVAYTDKQGRWRAGTDAVEINPALNPNQFLSIPQVRQLRNVRRQERGFIGFWNNIGADVSREEALKRYDEFLRRLERARTEAEIDAIRAEMLIGYGQ